MSQEDKSTADPSKVISEYLREVQQLLKWLDDNESVELKVALKATANEWHRIFQVMICNKVPANIAQCLIWWYKTDSPIEIATITESGTTTMVVYNVGLFNAFKRACQLRCPDLLLQVILTEMGDLRMICSVRPDDKFDNRKPNGQGYALQVFANWFIMPNWLYQPGRPRRPPPVSRLPANTCFEH